VFSLIAPVAYSRMPLQWFGIVIVIVAAVLVLAGMTIHGGYSLRIRSYPFDVELIGSGVRSVEPRR
jgi:hypothetical protein